MLRFSLGGQLPIGTGSQEQGASERHMRLATISKHWIFLSLPLGATSNAWAQQPQDILTQNSVAIGEGWRGLTDIAFLGNTLLTLTVAAVLGAIIAYHPKHVAAADTLEELEAPKVYILYAVIGAIIGILVVEYGTVVGLVIFGIGGLIRFRTLLRSANLTGRVIFVTLIGLTCGLNLPHVAILSTVFAFILVYILEARITYRIDVHAVDPDHVADSAAAYRELLSQHGCRILAERKNPIKRRITFLIAGPRGVRRGELEDVIDRGIEGPLKGTVDWQTDCRYRDGPSERLKRYSPDSILVGCR